MRAAFLFVWLAALLASCSTLDTSSPAYQDPRIESLTRPTLERFANEAEFLDYIRAVRKIARDRGIWWAHGDGPEYAAAQEVPCPPGVSPPCYSDEQEERIVVTGSRISAPANSITNNQMQGVDEGDIVKQFGSFLIVLQDGRLFSVNTRPGGRAGLALVDRANVYRHKDEDTWYDEMLVHQNRIVITGYSYERSAAEFSVFTINNAGRFKREATYYISSNDYYTSENYATRLVDGKLVIRSSLELTQINPDQPLQWPVVRRWLREGRDEASLTKGVRVFDARDIYRPVQPTSEPAIHSVSVCDLGTMKPGDELDCRTTALVAPSTNTYFVSPLHAYLWVSPGLEERGDLDSGPACNPARSAEFSSGPPASLFQLPLSGNGTLRLMRVRGEPYDQFGLDASATHVRALTVWNGSCEREPNLLVVKYFEAPVGGFDTASGPARPENYIALPDPKVEALENRFTDSVLIYGGRNRWGSHPPEDDEGPFTSTAVAVPLATPQNPTIIDLPHDAIRIERVGDNAVVTGYHDAEGLGISLLDLRNQPRLASTITLSRRYESEGRSHAYNATVETDGSGIMGVPTVERTAEADRWVWRSEASDVSFVSLDKHGGLASLGPLKTREKAEHPSYKCEVSCVDWYGNSRPIFTDGRIFALSATEIIEGKVRRGQIKEIRRINLTVPIARRK